MIPHAVLPHRITVEAFLGATGAGPAALGAPKTVRARVIRKRQVFKTPEGVDVVSSAVAIVRPGAVDAPPQSAVTHGDRTYEVLTVETVDELRRAHHDVLVLGDGA